MEPAAKIMVCVSLSLAAHGAILASRWALPGAPHESVPDNQILVSYVDTGSGPSQEAFLDSKNLEAPPPVKTGKPHAQRAISAAVLPLMSAPAPPQAVRTSEDLMSDPVKGKLFSAYFTSVKNSIARTVKEHYDKSFSGGGAVTLYFILNPDGSLQSASVIQKTGKGDAAKEFALRCLNDAAPFGAFPKELSLNKISFNTTVRFE
jgi:hypothetical protein